MTYPGSVAFLYALGNEIKTAKFGLKRITRLLEGMGNPHRVLRFIHVAGTNGKGSVCAMIESGLRATGVRTGLFTSPHLVEPVERIRLRGVPVSPDLFASAFGRVHRTAEGLLREGKIDLHPTYFETVTAMGLLIFAEADCTEVVLEVGLGGRLDATNVVSPALTVITPVDFDHEALLGKSLEAIAGEKAGILKPGVPAVFSRQRPEAARVLDCRAAELRVPVTRSSDWAAADVALGRCGSEFAAVRGGRSLHIECPLAGEHQVENALTAVAALAARGVPDGAIESGLARVRWPGRLERISERPEIVLDGAHNPAGARALAAHIARFYAGRPIWIVYGAMRDKAVEEIGGILFRLADRLILTAPAQTRAVRPEALAELAAHPAMEIAPDVPSALARARRAPPDAAVFVTGSLFVVGEAEASREAI